MTKSRVFGYIARHYLELDSKVSFCSRMKPLLDNLLRFNTEEGRLVIVETPSVIFWQSGAPNRQNDTQNAKCKSSCCH